MFATSDFVAVCGDMVGMSFEQLSRLPAIKVPINLDISIEECSLAVGAIVGYDSVVSASRMNVSTIKKNNH